jgi:hypothetical protein
MQTCVRWGNDDDDELAGIAALLESPIQVNTTTPVNLDVSATASPAASAPPPSPRWDDPWSQILSTSIPWSPRMTVTT